MKTQTKWAAEVGAKVILGHVKCVPDLADHGQENEKNAVRGQEMPAWRGRSRDGIPTVGEMGYDSAPMATPARLLTHPITTHARATKLRRMGPLPVCLGLPCGSWTRPACCPRWQRRWAPTFFFLPVPIEPNGGPTAVALARQSCPSPSAPSAPPSALHPKGEAAGGAKWETDRLTWPGSGWIHRDPAPGF